MNLSSQQRTRESFILRGPFTYLETHPNSPRRQQQSQDPRCGSRDRPAQQLRARQSPFNGAVPTPRLMGPSPLPTPWGCPRGHGFTSSSTTAMLAHKQRGGHNTTGPSQPQAPWSHGAAPSQTPSSAAKRQLAAPERLPLSATSVRGLFAAPSGSEELEGAAVRSATLPSNSLNRSKGGTHGTAHHKSHKSPSGSWGSHKALKKPRKLTSGHLPGGSGFQVSLPAEPPCSLHEGTASPLPPPCSSHEGTLLTRPHCSASEVCHSFG